MERGVYLKKLDLKILEAFRQLDTTSVSDAMDRYGICGALNGISPVTQGTILCGQAFTVSVVPCSGGKDAPVEYLDLVDPDMVVVIDNSGRTDCTVWGDLMSIIAMRNGVAGTLIDGVCRDIAPIRKMRYPIFTKGVNMVTGKQRVYTREIMVPIRVSGVRIEPGDLILADDSGALAIPIDRVEEVLTAAQEIDYKEKLIEDMIREGKTLKEAREATGYRRLQSKVNT